MLVSKQERQRQTILQLWNEGVRKGTEINRITNIPLSTVYDNIKKIKKNNMINRKQGSRHLRKITSKFSKSLGQTIRRNTSILTKVACQN